VAELPRPLFQECRELVLRKCSSARRKEVGRILEKEPFGELERLVTQKLVDVAQGVAKEELQNEEWLHRMAQSSARSYEQVRVAILEFLDTDVFDISVENCVSFLDPLIDSWDIDLKSFGIEVVLTRRLAAGARKRFEFAEKRTGTGRSLRAWAGAIPERPVIERRRHRRGNRVSEGAQGQGKEAFSYLLLPGTTESEGSTPFPSGNAARRIRLIAAVQTRRGSKGIPL
jgi:hypothetical protein